MTAPPAIAGFMYHDVADDAATSGFQRHGARAYTLTPARFGAHLDAIARASAGSAPVLIPATDLRAPGRHVALTFDDGGASAMRASEMLLRHSWHGHFFIVTSLIGTRGFLTAADLRELRRLGHVIGSHSHTHPDIFRAQSPGAMQAEWTISGAVIAEILGEACATASVPGGESSARVFRSAAAAGYHSLFTSEPWLRPRNVDGCWVLGRSIVKATTPTRRIERLARFDGWQREALVRGIKFMARRALGPLYRLHVNRSNRTTAGTQP